MALPVGLEGGDAFAHLYAAYAPRIAGLARRFVAGPDAVDDIVQEALLRAYRTGLHLDGRDDPWPWLATVTRNLCHDLHRRHHGREVDLDEDNVVALVAGPERAVEDRARADYVARTLEELPSRQRHLLLLRHVEDVPCAEIAEAEGTTVEAVKSALGRARDAFRDRYEGWRGAVPGLLGSLATRARAHAGMLRPGAAGAVAALLALGLVPSSPASERDQAPSPSASSGPEHSSRSIERNIARDADSASPESAGGRLISFQPPESPDVPPTPARSRSRTPSASGASAPTDPSAPGPGDPSIVTLPDVPDVPDVPSLLDDLDLPLVGDPDPDPVTVVDTLTGTVETVTGDLLTLP